MSYKNQYLLVVNIGSTSVKTKLFDGALKQVASINADYGSDSGLAMDGTDVRGGVVRQSLPGGNVESALTVVFALWRRMLEDNRLELAAIGHRVVHGAGLFARPTAVSEDMLERLRQLDAYAPLHNPPNRLGIATAVQSFPATRQFAVFDTAFHRGIPDYAGYYALPKQILDDFAFYRYGFHGISCQYSVTVAARLLARKSEQLNLIVLHLGGGASITAIRNGVSVDTSMGFSPSEGLIMATRSGDLDPMIAITLQKSGLSVEEWENLLNHQSGLKGLCGEGDMRSLLLRVEQAEPSALLALDMYCYRIKKYIGAYFAVLGEVDALVFTAGIGAHAAAVRSRILDGLQPMGLLLDEQANRQSYEQDRDISLPASRSRLLVIQADEEREIARQWQNFLAA